MCPHPCDCRLCAIWQVVHLKKTSYFVDKAWKQSTTTHVASVTKQTFIHKSKVIANSLWPTSNLKISPSIFLSDPNCFWFPFCSFVCSPGLPSPTWSHTCSLRTQGKANTTSVHAHAHRGHCMRHFTLVLCWHREGGSRGQQWGRRGGDESAVLSDQQKENNAPI